MRALSLTLLLVGCSTSVPLERPVVLECDAAFDGARQGDACELEGECGAATEDGSLRHGAVCDSGTLLLSRIEETREDAVGPCPGEWHEESDAFVELAPAELGCIDVSFCNEILGGGASIRRAHVCQVSPALEANPGTTHGDCAMAVRDGADGDVCAGPFACLANRELDPGRYLPIVGWCDGGLLRLAASQTLIHGG